MEKSKLAGNAVTFLHDEDYLSAFESPDIGADSWITVSGRSSVALTDNWAFAVDPFDTGFRQRWFEYKDGNVPRAHDWNPYQAEVCTLPGVWNLLKPELHHYEGGVWYCREIADHRKDENERLYLRFGAANYCTRVFLDGEFLGRHLGGSTPFCIEISGQISANSLLMVHVENDRDPNRLPSHHFDWFNYGGPHREIGLYVTPREHIRDFFLRFDGEAIRLELETTPGVTSARIKIPELQLSESISVNDGKGHLSIAVMPELWSPDMPKLYDFTISTGVDTVQDRIGFRTVSTSDSRVLINGKPTFLKGVCVHEDDFELGRTTTPKDIRRRFRHARAMGANFLRLAHYPHHEMVAQIADEEGFLIWEEIPAYWSLRFESQQTQSDARNQLTELIRRDRNRASVILWGLANETADTVPRNTFLSDLAALARDLDPSRLLSAACLFNQTTLTIEDSLTEVVDVVGLNEYFGWYDDNISDLRRILDQYDLAKPLLISETGCDVVAGMSGSVEAVNSEEFGQRYYEDQIKVVEGHPAISGFTPWLLYDFRSERRQNSVQKGWNRKGLIAEDKTTYKKAFNVIASYYQRCSNNEEQGD